VIAVCLIALGWIARALLSLKNKIINIKLLIPKNINNKIINKNISEERARLKPKTSPLFKTISKTFYFFCLTCYI
jgi:hypothetical protein